ncbi:CRISPR-associated RAMP protein Csx10 [Tolypothrix sp. FACHB-123]|uniref:type III-D CRISPR-associated RAMP protein Csx10 n=1 Tax=Tolypothrix sp. FACHB-123 TaxID=2692868 RepID=UPI001684ED5A|nr:CRISPR-associated RAMP protein Csx10 [Tolypothrix sp. FACHB-123]MBD2356162.1 CRISPR-associated RAMP protein Csx10 [Tolypothrix sp. FACHB-123]
MKQINLEIKALSPLAIGRQKPGGSISEAETYIPGSVIRGAIASVILKRANTSITHGDDFHELFLGENPAIFHNAYPADFKIKSEVRVLPNTALSSKNKPGFKSQPNDPKHNGVFDTLIDRFCAESFGHIYDPNCPVDGGRVDAFTGFYQVQNRYYRNSTTSRLLTRVGINRRRATSEEQVLYSIEVLNESQDYQEKPVIYRGTIFVADDLAEPLYNFLNNHPEDLRLGGAASRGLGRVKIAVNLPCEIKSSVNNRVKEFNQKLRQRWEEWKNIFGISMQDSPENSIYFTVDLQADAILTENWQRTTLISEKMLQNLTGINNFLELHAAYSSYDYRSGWNSAWGLMKDVELITNKGSVYLFSVKSEDLWEKAWENLEIYGVGDRTCEGFGKIQICNEFHNVFREIAK